jgi:hypothetical protein
MLINQPKGISPSDLHILCKVNDENGPSSSIYILAFFHPTSHTDMRAGGKPGNYIRQPSHLKDEQKAALSLRDSPKVTQLANWANTAFRLTDV